MEKVNCTFIKKIYKLFKLIVWGQKEAMKGISKRMGNHKKITLRAYLILMIALLLCIHEIDAKEPEYISLNIEVGKAYEVEGYFKESLSFIALEIEALPKPRKPKLRGQIESIDLEEETITLFGKKIDITSKTKFISDGTSKNTIANLKKKQLVQVTCRIRKDGSWKATKIKIRDVKKNHKVKGTVTRVAIDGNAPDTIEVSGLIIILNNKTDVNNATSSLNKVEKYLFGHLRKNSVYSLGKGYMLNDYFNGVIKYRQNWLSKNEYDLSTFDNTDQEDSEHDIRTELTAIINSSHSAFAQVRLRKRYVLSSEQGLPSRDFEANITQLYYLWHNIADAGFAVSVGRQDFDEPREWLFDDYMDAVRVFYYGKENLIFESAYITAINPIKSKFDTWTDLFGQVTWFFQKDNQMSAYYLKRSDTDIRNREPKWIGVRYLGEMENIKPWAELSFMSGVDKGDETKGKAFDIGATIFKSDMTYNPSITLAYAFATGDDPSTPLVNERFRQTAYQDNVASFNGQSSLYYYGTLLDPELSNLKIFTLGFGVYPTSNISFDIVYHNYKQHFPDNTIKGSNLNDPPARPNGFSDDIGSGIDFITAFPVLFEIVEPTLVLSMFTPGEAFASSQETATYAKLNLSFII